jgi:uncharacterized lipoprotein YmbA
MPSQEPTEVVTTEEDLIIGVGPVELSEYLDRPQIVTQTSESEHGVDQFSQWAEPLEINIARVLARNLSALLSTKNIFLFPWSGSTQIDYQAKVNIIDFKGTPDNQVLLRAHYTILDGNKKPLQMNLVNITQPISEQGYEGIVSSMSKVLNDLGLKIAQAIKALLKEKTELEP